MMNIYKHLKRLSRRWASCNSQTDIGMGPAVTVHNLLVLLQWYNLEFLGDHFEIVWPFCFGLVWFSYIYILVLDPESFRNMSCKRTECRSTDF